MSSDDLFLVQGGSQAATGSVWKMDKDCAD